ncbi:glycosyltransferase family 4 protein [Streptomyces sp. WAC 06725]|uniref:glycosyltransferase n=1 Tax=Streptomyces sp. WAC 06725 TaxID=2203209 RepID=UPI000F73FD2A|nr:glycosyltransferase [Streptomyces sp. WAC 06725]RSO34561.1 glycosyltransferase family 4 protein [Streptomyces sp. WAC 06725]
MKITFLLHDAYTAGVAVRNTTSLATALAARHEVEIVSLYRTADRMPFAVAEEVTVRAMVDLRPASPHYAGTIVDQWLPGAVCPYDTAYTGPTPPSRLGEGRLAAHLRDTDADVVVATQPHAVCFLAEHGRADHLRIGQEYRAHASHRAPLRRELEAAIARLDAYVSFSWAAARAHRAALPHAPVRLTSIPVCSPVPGAEPSTGNSKVVLAAGRLLPAEGYDRFLDAFAKVVKMHPDWSLRIHGRGGEQQRLRRRVGELGLHDHVLVMGTPAPMGPEWAKGAIAVVSGSGAEPSGTTLVEAMSWGLPVVSTDSGHAPRELITPGQNGLFVPDHGPLQDTLADALRHLIENEAARRRMAGTARRTAERFRPELIAAQYEALFTDRASARAAAGNRTSRNAGGGARWRRRVRLLVRRLGPAQLAPSSPTVACRVTTDGSLVFALPPRHLGPGTWSLTLRPRDPERAEPIQLPVERDTAEGARSLHVTLDKRVCELAEGDWDVLLARCDGRASRPVRAGLIETAHLLEPAHQLSSWREGIKTWIPYPTPNGTLALRAWHRPAHAEVVTCGVENETLRLTGQLLGWRARAHHYRFQARLRGAPERVFETSCQVDQAGRFGVDVPFSPVAGHHPGREAVWELLLRAYGGGPEIRLGMVTGDLVDHRHLRQFPVAGYAGPDGELLFRPRLTREHDLVLAAETAAADRPHDLRLRP